MLEQIKLFFEQHLALSSPEGNLEDKLKIATAVLFLEMMHIDDKVELKEQHLISDLMKQKFAMTDDEIKLLIELAEQQRHDATDYFQFTSLINKEYSAEQKNQLIESLWQIAFIDGVIDMHEEYLVRKIAELLYVPHADFIKAKNRVIPD
ncbi:MAG: TerB family tellurite resistance protein [Methylococcaceae bacterium]|jgi:Uncharacterized protein conserved in bacteria